MRYTSVCVLTVCFLSESFLLSLELDSLVLVEVLSSVLSLCLCVFDFWISASRYWVTLLVLGINYLLDDFLASLGFAASVKELFHLMVKLTDIFLWSDNSTFEWSSSTTGNCWFMILYFRLNVNWSRWMLHHS